MLHKITLKPNELAEIAKVGQFIKVLSCEGRFEINATAQGSEVAFTEAGAGFDLSTVRPFDRITFQSEREQRLEVWVSAHKLSYDALSTKPSRSQSYVVNHFGQEQSVLAFDPAQSSAKIVSEGLGFWIGGEGVNKENGIYNPAGKIYEHNSAAPLFAYVDATPDKIVSGVVGSTQVTAGYAGRNAVINGNYVLHETIISSQAKQLITNIETGASTSPLNEKVSSAVVFGDSFIGLRTNDQRDLMTVNNDGTYQFTTNPNAAGFTSRCVVKSTDGGLFVLGEGYSTNPNKIHKYKGGVWSLEEVPAALVSNNISQAFIDEYEPTIWLKANDGVYKSTDNLKTVEKVNELDGVSFTSMSFSDTAVMFKTKDSCFVMTRETRDLTDLFVKFTDFTGATLIGEQWVVISERFVYASSNKFVTSNVVYEHDFNFAQSSLSKPALCEQQSGVLNVWAQSSVKSEVLKFALVDDLTNPKAKIKVLKELF
ncbi:putative spike protein [Pseudoalteromonas phage Cr39582]|uniref:Putative spike protein n=1 Tax=Pseudoalteromonas phage Cr39582 TaxID=2099852 RepID=A0A2P1CKZ5_9VIRU|nr:putative spike protein [Pseudoalteromonas phage Cr39582]AVJ51880.1 putative spike protein [Pseudoalteromonas phage Cr39582]